MFVFAVDVFVSVWMSFWRINGEHCKMDGQADVFNNVAVIYCAVCVCARAPLPISGTEVIFAAQFIVLHRRLKLFKFFAV